MLVAAGCGRQGRPSDKDASVAVTTSYIECAVSDVADGQLRIVRVLPPGGCPGHFDVSPGVLDGIRHSDVLLRFDFQKGLDDRLKRLVDGGLKIMPLEVEGGLCVPQTYEGVCRAVCGALSVTWPAKASGCERKLAEIRRRMDRLGARCRERVVQAGLADAKVVASVRQMAFSRWLGLDVVGTFTGDQAGRLSEVSGALTTTRKGPIRLVIANQQEGDRFARSLSDRFGVRCVVFSNFPSMEAGQRTFEELVLSNVAALVEGGS